MDMIEQLSLSDLQEQHRQYAEVIGIHNLIRLVKSFGGCSFYVPKKSELLKQYKYSSILKEYNGTNLKQLAAKYEVSESTIYRLLRNTLVEDEIL